MKLTVSPLPSVLLSALPLCMAAQTCQCLPLPFVSAVTQSQREAAAMRGLWHGKGNVPWMCQWKWPSRDIEPQSQSPSVSLYSKAMDSYKYKMHFISRKGNVHSESHFVPLGLVFQPCSPQTGLVNKSKHLQHLSWLNKTEKILKKAEKHFWRYITAQKLCSL